MKLRTGGHYALYVQRRWATKGKQRQRVWWREGALEPSSPEDLCKQHLSPVPPCGSP